jgi:precorrin-2 dehydrogenase / sirohydrochlorin ferrochelatase
VYYPINLDLRKRRILIIGGGQVAEHKALALVPYGARLTLVSPLFTKKLLSLAKRRKARLIRRSFRMSDLNGQFIVICATEDKKLNRRVAQQAKKKGQLVNVVDDPRYCSFIFPAVVRRGPLSIGISTDGLVPGLSKRIRKEIETHYGDGYRGAVHFLSRLRKGIHDEISDLKVRQSMMNQIIDEDFHFLTRPSTQRRIQRKVKKLIRSVKRR